MLVSLAGHDCGAQSVCSPVAFFPVKWPLAFYSLRPLFVSFGSSSYVGHISALHS